MNNRPVFYSLRRWKYHWQVRLNYSQEISLNKKNLRVIIGAGNTNYDGWIKTDYPFFDILNGDHWSFLFKRNKVHNLLAEHVLEHMTQDEVSKVLDFANNYLVEGGVFRIAVPDRNHPDPKYIENVKPGGSGPGADDHKSFWDYKTLLAHGERKGFGFFPVEYWDESLVFNRNEYSDLNGIVQRRCVKSKPDHVDYTSLIVDFVKRG